MPASCVFTPFIQKVLPSATQLLRPERPQKAKAPLFSPSEIFSTEGRVSGRIAATWLGCETDGMAIGRGGTGPLPGRAGDAGRMDATFSVVTASRLAVVATFGEFAAEDVAFATWRCGRRLSRCS
ncbi:hypothetical protein D3C86_1660210 [compost metagenome]